MTVRTAIRLLPLAGLLGTACGPGVAEGPVVGIVGDTDEPTGTGTGDDSAPGDTSTGTAAAGDTGTAQAIDTGTGTDSITETGTGTQDQCAGGIFNNNVVFRASDLLDRGRFVAMSVECLLLREEVTGGTRAMVVFTDPWESDGVRSTVEMVSTMEPLAITCHPDKREAIVLFDTGGGCAVYEVTEESGEFTALGNGGAFAVSLKGIKRLMRTSYGGLNRVCAFGEGIVCADASSGWATWETVASFEVSGNVNDLNVMLIDEVWSMVAVGPQGRIIVENADTWRVLDTGTTADLLAVSTTGDYLTAAGRDGVFVHGTIDDLAPYTFFDEDVVSLYWWSDRFLKGVTADGTVFEGQIRDGELALCPVSLDLADPVSVSILMSCGDQEDYLIMTETLVLGTYDCSSIVVV